VTTPLNTSIEDAANVALRRLCEWAESDPSAFTAGRVIHNAAGMPHAQSEWFKSNVQAIADRAAEKLQETAPDFEIGLTDGMSLVMKKRERHALPRPDVVEPRREPEPRWRPAPHPHLAPSRESLGMGPEPTPMDPGKAGALRASIAIGIALAAAILLAGAVSV
jgi:hypothetical protein